MREPDGLLKRLGGQRKPSAAAVTILEWTRSTLAVDGIALFVAGKDLTRA